MEQKTKNAARALLLGAGTLLAAVFPLEALTALGGRLRALSLSLPEDFWYDVHWHALPLTENLAGQVPRINGEAACALEAEKGYYYFRDRHSEAEHDWDEEPIMGRFSWNFTLAVYDTDTRTLHFLKLDT